MLELKEFDYKLPKSLIAQRPVHPRDRSRLLFLHKESGGLEHKNFGDLPDLLRAGDVLVMNNSKVFPARLIGQKAETGGKVEVFLLRELSPGRWQCLLGGHRRKKSLRIDFKYKLQAGVLKDNEDGTWEVEFNYRGGKLMDKIKKIGQVPLPPYIKRAKENPSDEIDYQTVYADDRQVGSVAAPTAGFHFTPRVMKKLEAKGVQLEYITLHVGLGTFAPVKTEDITKHKMHSERVEADKDTIMRIIKAKNEGRRIIAVGTTSTRTLEAVAGKIPNSKFQIPNKSETSIFKNLKPVEGFAGPVDIFIYPGYEFKLVDGLITNFHLPKSTLLMLVSALAGRENILKAYEEAIKQEYRFYSYGDAMLIL